MSKVISLRRGETKTKEGRTKYRLMELPPDICKLIEAGTPDFKLIIKGKEGDDAVICTSNKTYALRTVNISNSLVVTTGVGTSQLDILLGEEIHEIMELVPAVPKLDRLKGMLRGSEYGEDQMSEDENENGESRRYTRKDLDLVIQASEAELENAIKNNRILELDGYLRPLPLDHLSNILMYIFTSLVSYGLPRREIPTARLQEVLEQDHEVHPSVTMQVMQWFGSVDGQTWSMDNAQAVRQVGIGLLKPYAHNPIDEKELLSRWKDAVGDAFADHVNLSLLRGEYLIQPSASGTTVTYFSRSTLSTDPLTRFHELFLTRSKWTEEDILAFLEDIAVDKKDCDRLLLKFARRAVTDGKAYYCARAGL